jgi:hypothetical protein
MKRTCSILLAGLAAIAWTGCATTQQTSSQSDRTRTAHTVRAEKPSTDITEAGWTVKMPSDTP